MSRLVVVSNRVAPIREGEPTAGGLAAGVLDALEQKGGIWLGWSGEITDDAVGGRPHQHSLDTPFRNVRGAKVWARFDFSLAPARGGRFSTGMCRPRPIFPV